MEHPLTVDGAYTANDPQARAYAHERSRKMLDIAQALECDLVVLWYAREGTYMREAKDAVTATNRLVEALDDMLAYAPAMRFVVEPKPNEPMDLAYIPTIGHAVALGYKTRDPSAWACWSNGARHLAGWTRRRWRSAWSTTSCGA